MAADGLRLDRFDTETVDAVYDEMVRLYAETHKSTRRQSVSMASTASRHPSSSSGRMTGSSW